MGTLTQRIEHAIADKGLGIGDAWNLLSEAADLIHAQQRTIEAQRREIAELEADARRLRFLAAGGDERNPGPYLCDGFAGHDLHEKAWEVALLFGRDEAYPEDYLAAFRAAIDAAIAGDKP